MRTTQMWHDKKSKATLTQRMMSGKGGGFQGYGGQRGGGGVMEQDQGGGSPIPAEWQLTG